MEKNDLKSIWKDALEEDQIIHLSPFKFENIMHLKHSKLFSKILKEFETKIVIYLLALVTMISLVIYAFVILKIRISPSIILPFIFAGLFLSYRTISEMIRHKILSSNYTTLTLKEAATFFKRKIKKIYRTELIIQSSILYGIAIAFSLAYLMNYDGIKLLFQSDDMDIFLLLFILILVAFPLLIKRILSQRYKDLISDLNDTINYLNDES